MSQYLKMFLEASTVMMIRITNLINRHEEYIAILQARVALL